MLPGKTLAAGSERSAQNLKKPKDRVTILATAIASGDYRLPVGKSQNSRCLNNVNRSALPVVYVSQKKHGWIWL